MLSNQHPKYQHALLSVIKKELGICSLRVDQVVINGSYHYQISRINGRLLMDVEGLDELDRYAGHCIRKFGGDRYCRDKFLPFSVAFAEEIKEIISQDEIQSAMLSTVSIPRTVNPFMRSNFIDLTLDKIDLSDYNIDFSWLPDHKNEDDNDDDTNCDNTDINE